ncbi:type VI secretion system membrane subunit TssM [Pseudomonas gingeri]|uniref:Type VI secretion system membrane subunit TssM n=1 Tax=Pseudomonas gingeri TaxID=117681 RepID=A0A7Y8C375_9PSED|nr:type VI secretion system membrane subunit TssM [Pseudomonas gingeri]NWB97082.1 type VI secretion system membrane subunit TssM [Pseudomonas gingeri]
MKKLLMSLIAGLCQTWCWSLLLVLGMALFIWFAGPWLAVADYRFWASAPARLLSISVLFLGWGLSMVVVSWRRNLRQQAEEDQDSVHTRRTTQRRLDERLGIQQQRLQALGQCLNRADLYRRQGKQGRQALPWYLVMGPQGGGKSTLLEGLGLEPVLRSADEESQVASGDGQSVEGFFAASAVLLEAPGGHLEQPDAAVDVRLWSALLALLRRRRRHQPLNGILLVVSLKKLGEMDDQAADKLALQTRSRLLEIRRNLHAEIPVYLVFSHADSLAGFAEFFDSLSREEWDQVLGFSFPKTLSMPGKAAFREMFDALLERLNSQLIQRLHQERLLQRRARILEFPRQLERIATPLGRFVEAVFSGKSHARELRLRGVYLTSVCDQRPAFLADLLEQVVFPEAHVGGIDGRERRRIEWGQKAVYGAALGVLTVFGLIWSIGFSSNHERLERIREFARELTRHPLLPTTQDDGQALLAALDISYAATQVFPAPGEEPLSEHNGLYQGGKSRPSVERAYEQALRERLLPYIARGLETQVRGQHLDRETLLDSLRAYLMLGLAERREASWLKDRILAQWAAQHQAQPGLPSDLEAHLDRLLALPFSYSLDDNLIAQTRQSLRQEALASVVYRTLRQHGGRLPDYRLSQHLGSQGAAMAGIDHAIAGFYTQRGYQQFALSLGTSLAGQIQREHWVLGERTLNAAELRQLIIELEQLYFADYARHWGEAVAALSLQPLLEENLGSGYLSTLSAVDSPLIKALVLVRENTRFSAGADGDKGTSEVMPATPGKALAAVADQAASVVASSLPSAGRETLQRRFEPLHHLLDDEGAPTAELRMALQALNEVQAQLATLVRAHQPEQAAFELAKVRMSGQRDAMTHLRNAAARLPVPVSEWFGVIADHSWGQVLTLAHQYVDRRYQHEVYGFYKESIHQRYPFHAHSSSDVALNDFREFFKAQGVVERFFNDYLRPFVSNESGTYQLRRVDGLGLPMSSLVLQQMGRAQRIRQSFFEPDSPEPSVRFRLEPYTLDPVVSRAEFRFGNQSMEYRHGPVVPVLFHWPSEVEDGRTSLVLERVAERPVGIEKNTGPWSLFRLLDLMQTEYLSGRDVLVMKADLAGARFNYLLASQRSPNPFELETVRRFQLPAQL